MFNQCSFLFKSSSFNLAKLIDFKSRLCANKQVLKAPSRFTNIYTRTIFTRNFINCTVLILASTESFSLGKIFPIVL